MKRFFERNFATIILFGMGTIFLAIGIGVGYFGSRAAADEAVRAEELRALSPGQAERLVIGDEVLVEGVISERNSQLYRQFVAYIREEYQGTDDDGDPRWSEDERVTPRLLIEVGEVGGTLLQIGNEDYRIEQPHETWQDQQGLNYSVFGDTNTRRYSGFVTGKPITAIGEVQRGSEGPELRAEFIYGGTRAAYIQAQRDDAAFLPWFGFIFGCVGAILIGIGAFVMRQQR
jgi:hypothetical protein